jgi:hypothetical protein
MAHALFESPPNWDEVIAMSESLRRDCGRAGNEYPIDEDEALTDCMLAVEVLNYYGRSELDGVKEAVLDALKAIETCLRRHGETTPNWPANWREPFV